LEQKNVFRISIFNAGPDQQSLVVNKIWKISHLGPSFQDKCSRGHHYTERAFWLEKAKFFNIFFCCHLSAIFFSQYFCSPQSGLADWLLTAKDIPKQKSFTRKTWILSGKI
jgi:hypothetical protein